MGALFGSPEQSDVPSIAVMILSSKLVSDKVDDGIIKEALLDFYTSSGKRKPDQIIIFRDGVSKSQFNQVLTKLLRLASSLTMSGTLKIVVIVVRKTIIPSFFSRDLLTICYLVGFSADDLQELVHSSFYVYCGPYLLCSFDSFTIRAIYEVCGCFRDIIKPWWSDCSGGTLDTSAFQVEG
ncbi:protein argonaute 4A-like [Gossypium hirsutum]|uniref:Protein argonaute 4A-like n=1 Tax=Gossypium hirsutum TaxID=3635 RepID=A0ABM2ZBJ8_GOSHI|nr:protein argonaute 4A-like [Gossypium hirsutum]